jgi:hypothetical protein
MHETPPITRFQGFNYRFLHHASSSESPKADSRFHYFADKEPHHPECIYWGSSDSQGYFCPTDQWPLLQDAGNSSTAKLPPIYLMQLGKINSG